MEGEEWCLSLLCGVAGAEMGIVLEQPGFWLHCASYVETHFPFLFRKRSPSSAGTSFDS